MKHYLAAMRTLALVAFFTFQLSVFTCGFDIHVHAAESDMGHVAEHVHGENNGQLQDSHEQGNVDHGCHVHASHTFIKLESKPIEQASVIDSVHHFILSGSTLRHLPPLIEYPPKYFHS